MTDLSPVQQLIADHINAAAEQSRLFNLEDWKLIDGDEETAAIEPMDDALVAICSARPVTDEEKALRQHYLRSINVPDRIVGCHDLTKRVVDALIGGAS